MLSQLKTFPSIQSINGWIEGEKSLLFEGLWSAPKAAISLLILEQTGQNVLILAEDEGRGPLCGDLSFFSKRAVFSFPALDPFSGDPSPSNVEALGERFKILNHLLKAQAPSIIVAPLRAVLQRVGLPKTFLEKTRTLKKGEEVGFDLLPLYLEELGYARKSVVTRRGEFAVRGGLVDLFPISNALPFRIDFFDDRMDQIRVFDPSSQKSIQKVEEIFLSPASEQELLAPEKEGTTLLEYLGKKSTVIFDELGAIEDESISLKERCNPPSPFASFSDFFHQSASMRQVYWTKDPLESLNETFHRRSRVDSGFCKKNGIESVTFEMFDQKIETKRVFHPFKSIEGYFWENGEEKNRLETFLKKSRPFSVAFVTPSPAEERAFKEKLDGLLLPLPKEKAFVQGSLSSGFVLLDQPFALFPYCELTKRPPSFRQKERVVMGPPASLPLHSLEKGDLVVHLHNGIGKFSGIEIQNNHRGEREEFFLLEYANRGKLYVSLSQSHLISRYIGAQKEAPSLSTLGSKKWQQIKANAEKAIIGYAKDLLHLQAMREAKGGYPFPKKSEAFLLFEAQFPFTETEDQLKAVRAIEEDMESEKAMDRLVCGDVGYGKTEVAMRAAFKAAYDGKKQVAVLVPTTLLAMQHYETFKERMGDFPIRVELVSRLIKPKEVKQTIEEVAKGAVDILIGTHRMIGSDVEFKDLGLIIIDEEQRFGVRVKEFLKKMKVGVDCLTLSATPIPRTLYFSLIGARDLSVMSTPPQERVPIKTILAEREKELIQAALLRELSRKGQAYFVHNRVETIEQVAEELKSLVPSARVQVGHAQMAPDKVDLIFHQFKRGDIDVLVSTTIVENGVDIPNANTILIDRAETFGMADLYQLRGRVGRSNRASYAYFLVPKNRSLSEISRKRLSALVETSGFGGGMQLAMRDLEIRGAGDILGVQQSGNICAIGLHLYCKLLKRAVDALKKKAPILLAETRIEFHQNAQFPPSYIAETDLRMQLYHRLGETTTQEEIEALFEELIDRFGPLPLEAKWLYHLNRIRIFGTERAFVSLKFDKAVLHAKRQVGKTCMEKKILLPLEKNPEAFEWIVIGLMKRDFGLR